MSSFSRPPTTPIFAPLPVDAPPGVGMGWGTIWRLAWPLVLTMICTAAIGLLDTWIGGQIGPTQQAAVGLTMQLVLLINATTTAVAIGCQAQVSRAVGAGRLEDAGAAARQSILLALAFTAMVIPTVYCCAPYLFALEGASPTVQATGTAYFRSLLWGLGPMDLGIVLNAIFRAEGKTKLLLLASATEAVVWATGSLGLGWWAGWGMAGLALGFIAGKLASVLVTWPYFRRSALYSTSIGAWRPDRAWLGRIVHIGLPAGFQVLVRNMGMMAYFGILNLCQRPTEAVAAFAIGMRLEALAFLPVFALNIATATLVGQNLGAGRPDLATRAAWRVAYVGVAIMTVFGVVFFVAADALVAGFTTDPHVAEVAASYLRIVSISEPALGLVMVFNGALQGAGDARSPMFATIGVQIFGRLPLAYWLVVPMAWGPAGAWWAMSLGMIVQGVVISAFFMRGRWTTQAL